VLKDAPHIGIPQQHTRGRDGMHPHTQLGMPSTTVVHRTMPACTLANDACNSPFVCDNRTEMPCAVARSPAGRSSTAAGVAAGAGRRAGQHRRAAPAAGRAAVCFVSATRSCCGRPEQYETGLDACSLQGVVAWWPGVHNCCLIFSDLNCHWAFKHECVTHVTICDHASRSAHKLA
jgi:hypothetical protein